MSRSKKIFAAFVALFIVIMLIIVYDLSTKTTFPGQKKPRTEEPAPVPLQDTVGDTVRN